MRLKTVKITDFQSIRDSNEFEVGDITCLVGKNEAGKTAILKALYRLNPIVASEGKFDVTDDYPRKEVEDYKHDVETGKRAPARVVEATFILEQSELAPIQKLFGKRALTKPELKLYKGYSNKKIHSLSVDLSQALKYLLVNAKLPSDVNKVLLKSNTTGAALKVLADQEITAEVKRLKEILSEINENGLSTYIYSEFLEDLVPKFLYFDEYYQMRGHENIQALIQRKANKTLEPSDHPMLGLIELARLKLDELTSPKRTQELKNKIEGAGNYLSRQVLNYWSQNKHLDMRFDVRPAMPEDPEGMRAGTNIWAEIFDSRHKVTTSVGTRSRGFVWFFSFLAWYSQVKRGNDALIILLDEPGLSLHAKAQEDLLRYFEQQIKGVHQLIYSTHSPFMVDPQHFERVRIIQDKGIDILDPLPSEQEGTKVLTDILEATGDSLFPLQGALGYEIYQTLFVGPNSLVVEGVSDLLYLQTMSAVLQKKGGAGLSPQWTITPVGGSDKVPTFVALIGAQKGMRIATLIDIQKKDEQTIENLYKKRLLKKNHVLTFADFTGGTEADIEDMFDDSFFLDLINEEFKADLQSPIAITALNKNIPRINVRLEMFFKANPMRNNITYNHYRPARYFSEKAGSLAKNISKPTLDRFEKAFNALNALL